VGDSALRIELLSARHLEAARELITAVFVERSGAEAIATWHGDIRAMETEYARNPRQAAFLALDGEKVVGAAVVRHRCPSHSAFADRYDPERTCELGRVAVDPGYRRRGIAVALAEAGRAWARSRYAVMSLHTELDNEPALGLWRSICEEVLVSPETGTVYFELPLDVPVSTGKTPSLQRSAQR
jgi:ribosomal protein S18 acetylase RimI-like enzyme